MKSGFSDVAVKLLVSSSIYNPVLLKDFLSMERKKSKPLLDFIEVKQQCPMMVTTILPPILLTRMIL